MEYVRFQYASDVYEEVCVCGGGGGGGVVRGSKETHSYQVMKPLYTSYSWSEPCNTIIVNHSYRILKDTNVKINDKLIYLLNIFLCGSAIYYTVYSIIFDYI